MLDGWSSSAKTLLQKMVRPTLGLAGDLGDFGVPGGRTDTAINPSAVGSIPSDLEPAEPPFRDGIGETAVSEGCRDERKRYAWPAKPAGLNLERIAEREYIEPPLQAGPPGSSWRILLGSPTRARGVIPADGYMDISNG
jgi:hypothetical protein